MSDAAILAPSAYLAKGSWSRDVWTDERLALLCDNYHTMRTKDLAHLLNEQTGSAFTKNSVVGKARRLGLQLTDDERHERGSYGTRKSWGSRSRHFSRPRKLRLVVDNVSPEPELPFLNIGIFELKSHQCRWPAGDENFTFCGQETHDDSSYCQHHFRMSVKR